MNALAVLSVNEFYLKLRDMYVLLNKNTLAILTPILSEIKLFDKSKCSK